jgi:hypothetical protein
LSDVPAIAQEALTAQRHFFIAIHPPRIVLTSSPAAGVPTIPPKAIAVGTKQKNLATAGIISTDKQGRAGVTTALHALEKRRSPFFVQGIPGSIAARDSLTDSCFIQLDDSQVPSGNPCRGPLCGVTPRGQEPVWFEGLSSGRKETVVDGWTFELPWVGPGIQARVITPLVTQLGDSGAALVNGDGNVIGFSHSRTEFNTRSPHSIWMWAESVFSALELQ